MYQLFNMILKRVINNSSAMKEDVNITAPLPHLTKHGVPPARPWQPFLRSTEDAAEAVTTTHFPRSCHYYFLLATQCLFYFKRFFCQEI
jgi:hypothetical protein